MISNEAITNMRMCVCKYGVFGKTVIEWYKSSKEEQITVQAWSPIGRGRVLRDPLLQGMAAGYGVSVAQLCLRFDIQMGVMPLPKASSIERMRENPDLTSFVIRQEDMERIRRMPMTGWSGERPDRERVSLSQ